LPRQKETEVVNFKTPVVEGEQWVPGDADQSGRLGLSQHEMPGGSYSASINTLRGPVHLAPDDWILTGVSGERHVCKPNIFAQSFELART
jgi:hypothetical protein